MPPVVGDLDAHRVPIGRGFQTSVDSHRRLADRRDGRLALHGSTSVGCDGLVQDVGSVSDGHVVTTIGAAERGAAAGRRDECISVPIRADHILLTEPHEHGHVDLAPARPRTAIPGRRSTS